MNLEEFLKLNCTTNEEIIWYHNKQLITPVRFIRSYKYIQQHLIIQVFPPPKPNTNVSPYNKNHRLHVLRQDVKQIKFQITRPPPPNQKPNRTDINTELVEGSNAVLSRARPVAKTFPSHRKQAHKS